MSAPELVTKGDFAKLCGVSPGRVTQWIDEGKISGAALVGEGRSAKIRVDVAKGQVALRRDVGQALGNGLETRLTAARAAVQVHEEPAAADPTATDDIDRKLKKAKLEASERANRIAAAEEAATQGVYTEAAGVRAEYGRIAGQMVHIFEGALPEIATAIAAAFELDARDVTHHLNEQFRKVREQAAEAAAEAAKLVPEMVDAAA